MDREEVGQRLLLTCRLRLWAFGVGFPRPKDCYGPFLEHDGLQAST
jgi:hypothetical protein